jgi:hypothetical protein
MSYYCYIDKTLLPITPKEIRVKVNNKNKTLTLMDQGEVNIVKKPGLTEISFPFVLPNVPYPFAHYEGSFQNAKHFLDVFEKLKVKKKKVQFILVRQMPNGKILYSTNITVTVEDYDIDDKAEEGFDVTGTINLKQWVAFETKTCKIKKKKKKKKKNKLKKKKARNGKKKSTPTKNKKYTCVKGDTLTKIAKKFYGDSSQYNLIYEANKKVFKGRSPNVVKKGDVLTIPPLKEKDDDKD